MIDRTLMLMLQTVPQENDVWEGWGSVILVVTVCGLFMIIVGVLVWQIFKTWQANLANKAAVARDEEFRKLSEVAQATQHRLVEQQERLSSDMTDLRGRLTSIEQLLRQVE